MAPDFGENMKTIREKRGMTLEEMASYLGTTKQALSRYERGERTPKITVAAKYAKMLNIDLEDLIGYEYHDSEPTFEDAAFGEDLSRFTADDFHLLEELHQNPRLRILFDRNRRMSPESIEKMIKMADIIEEDLYGE
jgi:transcriptional regulator with XRE-family HTH domain